jgi:polysaccharide export outer membrane protein
MESRIRRSNKSFKTTQMIPTRVRRYWFTGGLLLLWVGITTAAAQTPISIQKPAAPANADTNPGNLPIQRIGPDDLISIQVYDSPELTRTARVSQDGYIRLPIMAKPVKAAGLLPSELENFLADELKEEQILVRPIVSISVVEYRSRPIRVIGAVQHPLTFQAFGTVNLLDALTRADGLSQDAGTEILVTKPAQDGGEALVQRIPVKGLIDASDPALNLSLHGGEEIRVPEASKIFVMGNVKKPGAFPMRDASESSVLRALAIAEGVLPYSAKEAYIIRRGDSPHSNEIPIPLARIMDRKAPDVPLLGNDVLYIPDNKAGRITASTLEKLAGFGIGTMSGILVWRK